MTRIDNGMDWIDLEKLAVSQGLRLIYRVARCQHGKTRRQTCRDCEYGYADDHHTFANIGNVATMGRTALIAVSDDGDDVAYVSAAQQSKVRG